MSEYARYPEYKDSGVPWLGEIPSHWQNKRLKYTVTNVSEKVDAQTSDLRYFGLENIQSFTGKLLSDVELVSEGMGNTFKKDDVLFGKLRPYLAKVYLAKDDGLSSTEALIFRATENIDPNFLFYFCLSPDFISAVNGTTFGSKMPRASWDDIASFKMVYPSLDEQAQIANFLDHELGKIDALIEKQQLLLDKLAEQRSAVITQAVTKGLNHNAEMRDSGVAWLGDVPSHWQISRLKNSILSAQNGVWGSETEGDENDIYCLRVADFNRLQLNIQEGDLTLRNILPKDYASRGLSCGDLLLEKSGGGDKQPVGCVVLNTFNGKAVCSNFVARVKLAENMDSRYWTYFHSVLYSARVNTRSIKQSTGIQNLDATLYFNELACYPSIDEQVQIADFLDQETQKIDQMTNTVNRTIERLKEYRSTLITQAVTGKIKVF